MTKLKFIAQEIAVWLTITGLVFVVVYGLFDAAQKIMGAHP